jgi:hypothetical protein
MGDSIQGRDPTQMLQPLVPARTGTQVIVTLQASASSRGASPASLTQIGMPATCIGQANQATALALAIK